MECRSHTYNLLLFAAKNNQFPGGEKSEKRAHYMRDESLITENDDYIGFFRKLSIDCQ